MVFCATVVYPNDKPDAKFDMDYYLEIHMPLVGAQWGKFGLKEWRITKYDEGLEGNSPAYRVQAILHWDSMESVKKALAGEEAKIVFEDIPKFTDIVPVFAMGDTVKTQMVQ